MLTEYKKTNVSFINNNYELFLTYFKDIEEYFGGYTCNPFDDHYQFIW